MPLEIVGANPYELHRAAKDLAISYSTAETDTSGGRSTKPRIGHSIMVPEDQLQQFVNSKQEVIV